ncbi:MAG TPA: peptidoglycan-binding protein [Actinomycetota bacterium]|jgi:peptidoglycan hydrolase-like protein with peptidoglycan-binding domain|nr:peptidoglycan-binding protein [Actinomycetota bacterium]
MAIPLRRRREALPAGAEPPRRRRRRITRPGKRFAAVFSALVVGAVAAAALVAGGGAEPKASTNSSMEFATVRRTDLVSVRTFDGEVAAQDGPTIGGRLNGTITWLPEEGTTVERGKPLYAVDGLPILLFYGSTPAFRDFGGTISGNDVKQLEENLDALGFDPGEVDTTFTSTTESAVKAWQDSLDLPQNGVVQLGRIVFAPGALTIAEHLKTAGAQVHDGDEVLSTTSSQRVVNVTLEDAEDLKAGDQVSIVGSGAERVPAKVASVDTPSSGGLGGEESSPTATVVPDDPNALGDLEDGADVDVELVEDERKNVLVVPVTALLARQSGGYAVEVRRGSGTSVVTVEPGLYADDLVEVSGDIREGDEVVVP